VTETPAESARSAVELLTAWLEAPDGPPDFFVARLQEHIEEHPSHDQGVAAVALVMGLTQLSGGLLVMVEHTTGIPAQEILQQFGLLYGTA